MIAGSMVAVFARYPAEGVDVSYTSQEHVQDVAATIFSALGTRAEHLRAATTGWGDDPLRACTGVNETDAYGTRVTVLGRDGSIVCGEPVPEKRVEEIDWSLANGELQLSVPGAAKWFVFSTKVDTLLSRALGSEFAHRVVLIDAEGTTIGALVGNAAEPDTLETSVALVPGTNWRIALSEATARRSGGNPLPLMAGVVAIALVPFAVGHRSWGRDAVRLGDLAGQTVVVFDEQMNTRHAPANLDLGTCPLNLLRVLHAEDRERVVSTLATMPILTPVRCRIHGFEFPIDVVVLTAPHNKETEQVIDASALAQMRPEAVLVNIGRGGLVDDDALYQALTTGAIAGAALDVGREPDNLPSVRLATLPNVVAA
ncbi:MAG: NAD(P)-dependent oxidoreductase, partial [Phycisphaeraceae bacterium]